MIPLYFYTDCYPCPLSHKLFPGGGREGACTPPPTAWSLGPPMGSYQWGHHDLSKRPRTDSSRVQLADNSRLPLAFNHFPTTLKLPIN